MFHILKCDPMPFQLAWNGKKTFEIRLNDRNYQPGDAILLRETKHPANDMRAGAPLEYTGRVIHFIAPVVYEASQFAGLASGWAVLAITDVTAAMMPS